MSASEGPFPPMSCEVPFHPETTLSISEVSDATEIKSLSENPTRSDRLGRRKSKQWKDRLLTGSGKDSDSHVLVQDNSSSRGRSSNNATPLTDEIPVIVIGGYFPQRA